MGCWCRPVMSGAQCHGNLQHWQFQPVPCCLACSSHPKNMAALVAARRPGALAFLEPMGWGSECLLFTRKGRNKLPKKQGTRPRGLAWLRVAFSSCSDGSALFCHSMSYFATWKETRRGCKIGTIRNLYDTWWYYDFHSKPHIAPPVSIDAACLACPKRSKRANGTNWTCSHVSTWSTHQVGVQMGTTCYNYYIYIIYIYTNYVHWRNSWYNMVQQMSTWQWRHCSAAWTTGCWVCRQERQHREPKAHRSSVNPPKAVSQEGVCCRKTMRKLWENLDAPWTLISFRNLLLLSM